MFDTAGLRRRSRIEEKLEKLSVADALRAIRFAEVVVMMMDAQNKFEEQDLRIADLIEREGRAIVMAVNKWDLMEKKGSLISALRTDADHLAAAGQGRADRCGVGPDGRGHRPADDARSSEAYAVWNKRVPTAALNRWFEQAVDANPPPAVSGRRLKLNYITQAKARPPSFILFCSRADAVPQSYLRYLTNAARGRSSCRARRSASRCAKRPTRSPTSASGRHERGGLGARRDAAGARAARRLFIFVTILLDMLALGLIIPVLPKLVESFVDNDTASAARIFGLFGTAWALMQFFFSPILGALSDRFGRRPVVLLSNFGLALDYVLMALAPSLVWLFIGRVISGITSASISTAFAYIADVTPPERRAAVFGKIGVGVRRRIHPRSRRSAACSATSIRGCRSGSRRV